MLLRLQSENFIREFFPRPNRKSVKSSKRVKNWVKIWKIAYIIIYIVWIRDPNLEFRNLIRPRIRDYLRTRCPLIPSLNNPWILRTCYRIDQFDEHHLFSSNPNRSLFRVIRVFKGQMIGSLTHLHKHYHVL